MNDVDYREIVESERYHVSDRIHFLKYSSGITDNVRRKLWLLLFGLIETWDLVK